LNGNILNIRTKNKPRIYLKEGSSHEKDIKMTRLIQVIVVLVLLLSLIPNIPPAQATLTWRTEVVDSDWSVGLGSSIALDGWNSLHISYYDENQGDLKYAYKAFGGLIWITSTVDSGVSPSPPPLDLFMLKTSIAIDAFNGIHISYHDENQGDLKYAYKPIGGPTWTITTVDSEWDAGQHSSIAIDEYNNPHISYYKSQNLVGHLMYASKTDVTWDKERVPDYTSDDIGSYTSLALDRFNNPHISYYGALDTNRGNLRYANKIGGTWNSELVDGGPADDVGRCSSIAVDQMFGIHISYIDADIYDLKYAYFSHFSPQVPWAVDIVDPFVITHVVDTYAMAISIALDQWSIPHISYHDSQNQKVMYASKIGATWTPEVVEEIISIIPQEFNLFSSLVLDEWNRPHVSYYTGDDNENGLKYARLVGEILFKVVASDPNGQFSFQIEAGLDLGGPVTSRTVLSTNNVLPPSVTLSNGDMEIIVGGQLQDPNLDGEIVLDAESNGEIITYKIKITPYGTQPGIVLLFDTSGSMSWSHEGDYNVPADRQRLYFAKQAAQPYLDLLGDHYTGQTSGGIATFPVHPFGSQRDCGGQVVEPMSIVDLSKLDVLRTEINGLDAEGNTPLLAGIETAIGMFTDEPDKVIILLSDGYHNCPTMVDPSDPKVTDLITRLNDDSIKVYTIGFGRPTDIDHPLLEAFARQTGGSFYDVTGPHFDPANWDAQTALQVTYKAILANWFGLRPVVDPFGSIGSGEKVTHEVKLSEYDRRVSFFVSWSTSQVGSLDMTIKSSDGQPVPIAGPEIRFHEGETYQILTVGEQFMQLPDKVGLMPWKIEINASYMTKGQDLKYQYSVISNSLIEMKAEIHATGHETGSALTVSAEITETGLPITGLTNVNVKITRPEEGIGNWFAAHDVSLDELNEIPENIGGENLSTRYRKSIYLTEERGTDFPGRSSAVTLELFDDGTHGDTNANDGNYTNTFTDTLKEGTYSFHFYANGTTRGNNIFERETMIQKYLSSEYSSDHSDIKVELVEDNDKTQRIRIIFTPMDSLGNHLGPGYTSGISMNVTWGQPISELQDNVDGTYSQEFELPTSVASKADVTVQMGGETKTIIWVDAPSTDDSDLLWMIIILLLFLWIVTIILAIVIHSKKIRRVRKEKSKRDMDESSEKDENNTEESDKKD
jgi:hypothetical protein